MPGRRHRWPSCAAVVLFTAASALMGCTQAPGSPSASSSEAGTASDAGRSPPPTPTPILSVRDAVVRLPAAGAFPSGWATDFVVPYGEARDQLGLADDHGGAAAASGPASAAPGSDGAWWALDVQKSRVARFSRTGAFLGATAIPAPNPDVWAPRMLGGWLYASGDPALLSSATTARRVAEPFPFLWTYDDGTSVYSAYRDNAVYSLRVVDGELVSARGEYMLTPNGNRFRFEMRGGPISERVLELELPDATPAVRLRLHLTSARSGGPLEASVELAADADGTIYVYLIADDNGTQVAALTAVTATGDIAYTEQTPNPFHAGDPGGVGGRLHVVPGSSQPSLVFDEERGMAVYSRVG